MDGIIIGWAIIALYLVVSCICMGREYAWFIGTLIAWIEGRALFGEQEFGKAILITALTITAALYVRNFLRWVHRRRLPLLIRQRRTNPAAGTG